MNQHWNKNTAASDGYRQNGEIRSFARTLSSAAMSGGLAQLHMAHDFVLELTMASSTTKTRWERNQGPSSNRIVQAVVQAGTSREGAEIGNGKGARTRGTVG